ncbi:MAG: helix-turn-helix domain-containing protein [Phycisphaeraceae bacterium]|nr:helix-turn-helix domain-containing protein [Phycisphaeraceae bacterium]MCP4797220.1 helix-turn-helix domain-containing protein [Phycisphaeraceae bacterium]
MITRSDSKDEWLTLNDAAERFSVSRRTLERLRKRGVLPGVRMGRYLSVRTVDVQQALAQRSPLQTYRQQAAANDDLSSRDWLIGWRRLFEGNSKMHSARKWVDQLIDEHGDTDLSQLSVGDVVRAGRNLKLTGDVSLIFEALSGVAPARNMLETTRTMLKILVPAI